MFNQPFRIITKDGVKIHWLSYQAALLDAVRHARRRVWIMSYVIFANLSRANDPITHLFSILRARHALGCDVKIILDGPQISKPNYHCNMFFMRHLMEWGFSFQTPPRKVTSHAKAVLIDDSVLFIGSHNLAQSSLTNPLDCTVEIRNEFIVRSFAEDFLLFWQSSSMVSYMPDDLPDGKYYG